MPYKDVERKQEWERQHRAERLARRRERRRLEAGNPPDPPMTDGGQNKGGGFVFTLAAASAVAAYNRKPAVGAGAIMAALAAYFKMDRDWWIAGVLLLVVGVFIQWNLKTDYLRMLFHTK
jgi:hypothetical protein